MKSLMKQIPILLLLSFILVSCGKTVDYDKEKEYFTNEGRGNNLVVYYKGSPYSGKVVYYYENGQLESKLSYKEGKRDGVWEDYYENGQVRNKESYKDNKKDGVEEFYYETGQLSSKGYWKNGGKDGVWEEYNEDGQIISKQSYKEGVNILHIETPVEIQEEDGSED